MLTSANSSFYVISYLFEEYQFTEWVTVRNSFWLKTCEVVLENRVSWSSKYSISSFHCMQWFIYWVGGAHPKSWFAHPKIYTVMYLLGRPDGCRPPEILFYPPEKRNLDKTLIVWPTMKTSSWQVFFFLHAAVMHLSN
jgi:hypothetical protein